MPVRNPGRLGFTCRSILCIGLPAALFSILTYLASIAPAEAVPSYARQTGQPCASCHTAFPELTPFGRNFKLNGYTMGGGDSSLPPIAAMAVPTFTNTKRSQDSKPGPDKGSVRYGYNDNLSGQQFSLFYSGKIFENLGAFIQATYSGSSNRLSWDNTDIRYANTTSIAGQDVLFGVSVNNNPTVQDPWNTTPAWAFPYITSGLAPTPAASTIVQGAYAGRVVGAGAYTYINDLLYMELSGYAQLGRVAQTTLGVDPTGTDAIQRVAPYWRVALAPTYGDHSFEVGSYGWATQIDPQRAAFIGSNHVTDLGFDAQYQYIGDVHAVTIRANFIHEVQNLKASVQNAPPDLTNIDPWSGLPYASVQSGHLNTFTLSASYIYDHTISATGAYFTTTGNADAIQYGTASDGLTPLKPNSSGFIADLAYLPFSKGGPSIWKWANARLGIQYTYYTKFDGAKRDIDGVPGTKATDNNTLLLYAWTAF